MLATLLRLLGNFDASEEALHDAFAAAAEQWPRAGVPGNPYAWLVSAGRFKTINRWRQNARLARALRELLAQSETSSEPMSEPDMPEYLQDDEMPKRSGCSP